MTKKPPVPAESQSPYPKAEAPHAGEGEALAIAKEMAEAAKRRMPSSRHIGMGAAIGVGSAAIVAGLLYWKGGRKDRK
ncbi:hypothetical protein SAMN03159338_1962 [Sphingomonas sp. NFR04]|uniref:hypothetical protein n=1 Tax=Sphingomonas sp. NFR04 TaxID=1566283 RepID=UPI0008EB5303|nr:hypothetical protein [Sphingomonas sp. NFR04]SFJ62134.1 hypothetical protein SAMN03159338_1962 [Sphingomonas sp. NFR04]